MPFTSTHPKLEWLGVDPDGVAWWELLEGFSYRIPPPMIPAQVDITLTCSKPATIAVPTGMQTDLASIPRLLQWWLSPSGPYMPAALVHDLLYARHRAGDLTWTRAQADGILFLGMVELGVGWWTRQAVYWGVRLGGGHAWARPPRPTG